MDVNKHQTRTSVKKLYDIDVAKVNTLNCPDSQKKAYVRLAPDYARRARHCQQDRHHFYDLLCHLAGILVGVTCCVL